MPYVPVNIVLDRNLAAGQSINVPYPEGRNEGHFFSAVNHTMAVNGSFYRSPRDFIVHTLPESIQMTWQNRDPLRARSVLNMQLEIPGSDFFFDPKNGVTVTNMVTSAMFMINLTAPAAPNEEFYLGRQPVKDGTPLKLLTEKSDCPRNVVISSSAMQETCSFLVEGLDFYERSLKEKIVGAMPGKKAFARITKITPSEAANGEIWIGTGDRIGLPVFLPAPGYLMKEIINGKSVQGGTVVSGDTNMPSATSSDCRGTYTPPSSLRLDGKTTIHLLVSLPNPANIGLADFS